MERQISHWSASSLTRHRTAIIALTAAALGCSLYYVHTWTWPSSEPDPPTSAALHRSNARRQRPRERSQMTDGTELPVSVDSTSATATARISNFQETLVDDESNHSWREGGDTSDENDNENVQEGQSLLNLVYRIAEEQAKTVGYVHRRVTCNACNTMPIRGIRYHCTNCLDFDLCEQCEAMQIHPKTHIFYKIRIPAPFMPELKSQPILYPGKPGLGNSRLTKARITDICKQTGFQVAEVDALWEQFKCLAATDWPDDHEPGDYHLAIDRQTFDKSFVPNTSLRPPPPNLIFDRMFSFYDRKNCGLIGFEEFIRGIASMRRKNANERQRRLFKAYDTNNDGYVDRKDFLRMFRAYYALTKELTRDVLAGMEDEGEERNPQDIILSNRPLSSAFDDPIPPGQPSRLGQGKFEDNYGDYQLFGGTNPIDEHDHNLADASGVIVDSLEVKEYGHLRPEGVRQVHCGHLYTDPWPPEDITSADVEKALGSYSPPEQVTVLEDQNALRRTAHARIARSHQERSYAWRIAIRRRKQKQEFYLDGEIDDALPGMTIPKAISGSVQLNTTHGKELARLEAAGQAIGYYGFLSERIERLAWPVRDPIQMVRDIREMILLDWTGLAIAEDLSGYARCFSDSREFVIDNLKGLQYLLKKLGLAESNEELVEPRMSSHRSRSSSKARFGDDITYADDHRSRSGTASISPRSVSANERADVLEAPEPERDVGREVLYQVTQEALNELLDPIFRLREDLALAVVIYKSMPDHFRVEAAEAFAEPLDLKRGLTLYQNRWLRCERPISVDEAGDIWTFLNQRANREISPLTVERCSSCVNDGNESWVPLGDFCSKCGKASDTMVEMMPTGIDNLPDEPCSRCAELGQESTLHINPGSKYCRTCDQPSTLWERESARLRDIISGQHMPSPATPKVPVSLHKLALIDDVDLPRLEDHIFQQQLDKLIAETGCATEILERSVSPAPDPTLPQNRPNAADVPPPSHENERNIPNLNTLRGYAALCLIEHEDEQRGGPGRLNFQEFDTLMKGEKGRALGFLGTWIDMASF